MSTKRGLYDISYHNSWYRSRKIKEDSSTEREKSPLQFEPIFSMNFELYASFSALHCILLKNKYMFLLYTVIYKIV